MISTEDLIPTLSSRLRAQPASVQVVEFKAHKSKKKRLNSGSQSDAGDTGAGPQQDGKKKVEEVDMKKARYEIMKFGMKKMSGGDKERTKEMIAVELGAKPDKNKFINYKTLQQERQRDKLQEREEKKLFEINRKTIGKKSVRKINRNDTVKKKMFKKRNKGGGSGGIIGKYGKPTLSVPKQKK
uniref:Uncharacterized protein n=1 Tax=Cacopsylla melanoneura TaxID=428564 RepID=A0A8D8UTG4_9HEMI